MEVKYVKSSPFLYLNRIHIATFLPFRAYNTDNQQIIDTVAVNNFSIAVLAVLPKLEFICFSQIHLKSSGALYSDTYTVCPSLTLSLHHCQKASESKLSLYFVVPL